jgi:hypothetical protein
MFLGPILIASISVVLVAIALFMTAAALSVDGARRRYERSAGLAKDSERRLSTSAELSDWQFPGPPGRQRAQIPDDRAA